MGTRARYRRKMLAICRETRRKQRRWHLFHWGYYP